MPGSSGSACEAALRRLATRSLASWRGLPPGCTVASVEALFPPRSPGEGVGFLGRSFRRVVYRPVSVEGFSQPVRVWSVDGLVVLMDVAHPELAEPAGSLLAALGDPEVRLDLWWDDLLLAAGEWVYPARGLTLLLDPDSQSVLHLAVYAVTSLTAYQDTLRLDMHAEDLPDDPDDVE